MIPTHDTLFLAFPFNEIIVHKKNCRCFLTYWTSKKVVFWFDTFLKARHASLVLRPTTERSPITALVPKLETTVLEVTPGLRKWLRRPSQKLFARTKGTFSDALGGARLPNDTEQGIFLQLSSKFVFII